MKCSGCKSCARFLVFALLFIGVQSLTAANGREETSANDVSGTYIAECVYSAGNQELTMNILSLVFPLPQLSGVPMHLINAVRLAVHNHTLDVVGIDRDGSVLMEKHLSEGPDYDAKGGVLTFHQEWHGDDEWGKSTGKVENYFSRAGDGSLVVRSVTHVKRRGLIFGSAHQVEHAYRFASYPSR